ncbi:Pathogenesis-related protein 5 [Rhizoctonia solani]|uniref:Pathogenesis-related protein 5 n=1 Tax=Rhizoctonia solani TaxID=456999 RepID=A0A0K6G2F3_9AGAM|nr:Pathogenesis-related protein 5 [Rhizoctonia solani]
MSRARSATVSVVSHVPRSSSPTPTARSQEPNGVKQLKDRHRRMTVCGAYDGPRFQSPSQSDTESIKSTTFDSPEQCPSSPAWSFISGTSSTSSVKSVQISESNDPIGPGQYAPNTPKPSPKSILKHREVNNPRLMSLFDVEAPLMAARAAIDSILQALVACVKEFKPPSELDFSATTEQQPLVLTNSFTNKPFTDQLCKLAGLRLKLAEIPTHGDEVLEDMHIAATASIDQALTRMKEYQLKLFKMAVMESKIAFDNLLETFDETVRSFQFPSKLDFPADSDKNGMMLFNTDNNKRFIYQLRKLDRLKVWLEGILTYGNPDFEQKHDEAYVAVEDAICDMHEHQQKLWKQSIAAKALDKLLRSVNAHVSEFEYPSTLDFPANAGNDKLFLLNTARNQKFVNQFHVLQRFRDQLVKIETEGNEQLEKKRQGVSSAIGVSLQKLKKHQCELREKIKGGFSLQLARCEPPLATMQSIFLLVFAGSVLGRNFYVYNACPFTIWPAVFTDLNVGSAVPGVETGWEAPAYTTLQFTVPDNWKAGRIWGRRNCDFTVDSGPNSCLDGGCNGGLVCDPHIGTGVPPATVAEWTLSGDGGLDYYDVSLVDGYNLPMRIITNVGCPVADCPVDLGPGCPAPLQGPFDQNGFPVGCKSACYANLDGNPTNSPNCCSGEFDTPVTCPSAGVQYYSYFKSNCPSSYVYAYDESSGTALFTCPSSLNADYQLTFCP